MLMQCSVDKYIKATGDLSEQILSFFNSGAFSEDSPVVKVLKLVNQEVRRLNLGPFLTRMMLP